MIAEYPAVTPVSCLNARSVFEFAALILLRNATRALSEARTKLARRTVLVGGNLSRLNDGGLELIPKGNELVWTRELVIRVGSELLKVTDFGVPNLL